MRIRHYAQGKFYSVECPEGTEIVRRSGSDDHLLVPLNGKKLRIPADPPELLPLLAESGNFGISLISEPQPEMRLDGVSCPGCGQDDVAWLQMGAGTERIHCDYCGTNFHLPVRPITPAPVTNISKG